MLRRNNYNLPLPPPPPPPPSSSDIKPALFITILILTSAIILSASLYLLSRFLHRLRRRHSSLSTTTTPNHHHHHRVSPASTNPLISSLPSFPFHSLTGSLPSADCAVCLSSFQTTDVLRLLPLCCHAFHADCIDAWLAGNLTCPLCRSPLFLSDGKLSHSLSLSSSFRVEIGNVSRRNSGDTRRSYSISGSFDYVINDTVSEVATGSFRRPTEIKSEEMEATASLVAEVGESGGWLKEFLSSSSRTMSFRGSGRWFFTGSSRRLAGDGGEVDDVEGGRLGEEISEMFRWLSGV